MRKLAQIQRLIEAEIPQMALPEALGAGPEFIVQAKPNKRKPFKRKFNKSKPKTS